MVDESQPMDGHIDGVASASAFRCSTASETTVRLLFKPSSNTRNRPNVSAGDANAEERAGVARVGL